MEFRTTSKFLCFLVIFFTVTCRDVTSQSQDSWLKLNSRPVCFGARDNQYGNFSVPYGGKIAGFKLVHLSGYVSCDTSSVHLYSFWGCGPYINVVITPPSNHVILPLSKFITYDARKLAVIPGYTPMSPEIVLPFFSPYSVHLGQQFRLWYVEDLFGYTESNNGGMVCCDVYALYV